MGRDEWIFPNEAPEAVDAVLLLLLFAEWLGAAEGTTVEITVAGRENDGVASVAGVAGVVGVLGRSEASIGAVGGVGSTLSASMSMSMSMSKTVDVEVAETVEVVVVVAGVIDEVVEGGWRSGGVFNTWSCRRERDRSSSHRLLLPSLPPPCCCCCCCCCC